MIYVTTYGIKLKIIPKEFSLLRRNTFLIMQDNTCKAATDDGSRCTNERLGESHHCKEHNAKAVKLYMGYKKLSNKLDTYSPDIILHGNNTKDILRYYSLLHHTYMGRLEHKRYAYTDESYDEGHEYQLTKLKVQLGKCEARLTELNDKSSTINLQQEERIEDDSSDTDISMIHISDTKKERDDMEAETDRLLAKYTKEVEDDQKKKMKIVFLIVKLVARWRSETSNVAIEPENVHIYGLTMLTILIFYNYLDNTKYGRKIKCIGRINKILTPSNMSIICNECKMSTITSVPTKNVKSCYLMMLTGAHVKEYFLNLMGELDSKSLKLENCVIELVYHPKNDTWIPLVYYKHSIKQ